MSKPRILADSNTPNSELVKNALNAGGDAPIYACRAWINFNGSTTPPTIRASGNVASVTRIDTGTYTINFIEPMNSVNYIFTGVCGSYGVINGHLVVTSTITQTSCIIVSMGHTATTFPQYNHDTIFVSFHE